MLNYSPLLSLFDGFPPPEETVRRSAVLLRDLFGAEAVSVLVHRPETAVLAFEVVMGGSEDLIGKCVPEGQGVGWWAFHNGYVEVPDCASDRRFSGTVDKTTGFLTRNIIALPFGQSGLTLGVLELLNVPSDRITDPETESLLILTAGVVGAAYAASRYQQALVASRQQLETANDSLERKVHARTAKLVAAMRQLTEKNDFLDRTRATLLQTEKMAALGNLAAGVAHEINNPIGFIASNLNTAGEYWRQLKDYMHKLGEANPEAARIYRKRFDIDMVEDDFSRLVDECLEGTHRVTNIVRNLREFAHQGGPEMEITRLHDLIDRTISIAISPFKHRIRLERDFRGPESLLCNGQDLGQVILNLVVNAAQAINGEGAVRIRTRTQGDWVAIEVEDTGVGIPEENQSRIFDPFFTTKEVGVGTGLGLSTCFHLVKKGRGSISVTSREGMGSVFRVLLPASPDNVRQEPPPDVPVMAPASS